MTLAWPLIGLTLSITMSDVPLLVRIADQDDGAPLSAWGWLVPSDYRPLFATAFGDLFLLAPDETIFFLNTLDGGLIDAAASEVHLSQQLEGAELKDEILMPSLAQQVAERLGPLSPGYCYSAIIPPSLGGRLEPSNFQSLPLRDHLSALGSIQQQIANDPPGTTYQPVLGERPER